MCVAVGAFVGCKDGDTSSSSKPQTQTEAIAEMEDFTLGFGTSYEIITNAENLVWQSSNQNVATVTQEGVVFGMGIGETTITVTDGVQTESCTLTVSKSNVVAQCSLYPAQAIQLNVNDEYPLKPSVSVAGVTLDYVAFDYESSNAAVATVDDNGVITAVALGDTTISVSYEAGGFEDTLEIPVKVVRDVVIELNQLDVTLAVEEIAGGTYKSETEIFVTALQVDDEAVDVDQVTVDIVDKTVASYEGTTLTALKAGNTTLTATYQNQNTTVTMYVPVNVVKERIRIEETGSVDVTWDATTATPVNYAFIELPYTLQLTDEEVELVADESGDVLTENNGLRVPKAAIKDATTKLCVETAKFVYELDVAMDNSCITLTKSDYASQFTNALGVRATAWNEEMDGRTDVLKAVSPKENGGVWNNHNGNLNFGLYNKSWTKGIFIFEVKADEGTPLGGWVCPSSVCCDLNFSLNPETKKFTLPSDMMKIVDENFNETTFQYGEWNTVVVDYTKHDGMACVFVPSFTNASKDSKNPYTAYYSNMRYMTVDAYETLKNESYNKEYTVTFETGIEGVSFEPQTVGFRDKLNTSELDIGGEDKFIGWACNDLLVEDLANLYVTEDITLTAIYDKVCEYKVVYLQRQINGSYKEVEADRLESQANMFTEVKAELKTYEGYTLNKTLSKTQGRVRDGLVLALYYENDAYAFKKMGVGVYREDRSALKKMDAEMTDVSYTDLRANTIYYKEAQGKSHQPFTAFHHGALPTDGYMLLNVYITEKTNSLFFFRGRIGETWTFWDITCYDENYNKVTSYTASDLCGKWITIAVKLNESFKDVTSSYITFAEYNRHIEMYLGEYLTITQAQYNQYFECSVTFDTGLGSKVESQTLKYGDKIAEVTPTWVGHEFLYWTTEDVTETCYADGAQNKPEEYNFDTAVTSDLTLRAVWKCLATETEYTVNHYFRTVYGTYELDASLTSSGEGVLGHIIEVAPVEKEGYTPNATLNAITAKGMLTEDTTFNVYYENDAYKFETQTLTGVNATVTKEEMTGVPAADWRPNTYKVTRAVNGSDFNHEFKYTADKVGKYLVMSVYYTNTNGYQGLIYTPAYNPSIRPLTLIYDDAGNLQPSNDKTLYINKWVNVVVYLDETNFKDKTSFRFGFANWAGDNASFYFGEYTFLTEEQFKANFQYIETDTTKLPAGVVGYKGDSLTYFKDNWGVNCLGFANGRILYTSKADQHAECGVIPSGVTTWSAGQYVAVKAYSYTLTGAKISLYGQTRVAILDDAGNEVEDTAVQANQWYTYVFKIGENDVAISKYSGSIMVQTETTAGIKFLFESVYSIADDTAYAAFKTWKGWNA